MMIKNNDLKEILFEGSEIIKKHFYKETEVNYKSDNSPVTIADLETNGFLKTKLMQLFPSAGWLSEEDKDNEERFSKEYLWVVDPLDGTREFTEKNPEMAISVALVKGNEAVLGAIINPITKEYGIGSIWETPEFYNLETKELAHDLSKAIITASKSEFKAGSLEEYKTYFNNIVPIGSVAYKLLRVASGKDDLYFSVQKKSEWDICAGIALLNLTNKKYVRFDKKNNLFNQKDTRINCGAVAGNSNLVNEFIIKTNIFGNS